MPTPSELATQELARRYSLRNRTQVPTRYDTVSAARPTIRSALGNLMRDAIDATGVGGGYRQGLLRGAQGMENIGLDFTPAGLAMDVDEASQALGAGDWLGAGISMLGAIPVVGDAAKKGANTVRSALRNVIPAGHASPHRFEKFSMDKIGTGEGAQVYGHGLYFAENPTVIDEYFNIFNSPVLRFQEKNVDTPYTAYLRDRFKNVYDGLIDYKDVEDWRKNLLRAANKQGLNVDKVDDELNVLLKKVFEGTETSRDFAVIDEYGLDIDLNELYDLAENQSKLDSILGGISQAKTMDELEYVVEGFSPDEKKLYERLVKPELQEVSGAASRYDVNLNVSPEELLDWDAPYSQQPEKVKQFLDNILTLNGFESYIPKDTGSKVYLGIGDTSDLRGSDIYRIITDQMDRNPASASQELNASGIKGIKYFDGMSRNRGEGTSNYVMFDDSLIDTKRINDQFAESWINSEARMQRAQDLGFDMDNVFYHGTSSDFSELQPSTVGDLGAGVYVTPNPEKASGYAAVRKFMKRQTNNAGPNVLPLRVRGNLNYLDLQGGSIMPFDEARIQSLKDQGYDGIRQFDAEGNVIQMNIFDPKNIRSINAEFDPTKADSADLLSSVGTTSALRNIA